MQPGGGGGGRISYVGPDIICLFWCKSYTQWPCLGYCPHPNTPFCFSNWNVKFQIFWLLLAHFNHSVNFQLHVKFSLKIELIFSKWPPILWSVHQIRPIFFFFWSHARSGTIQVFMYPGWVYNFQVVPTYYPGTRITKACTEIQDFCGKNKMDWKQNLSNLSHVYIKARCTKTILTYTKNQIFLKFVYYYFVCLSIVIEVKITESIVKHIKTCNTFSVYIGIRITRYVNWYRILISPGGYPGTLVFFLRPISQQPFFLMKPYTKCPFFSFSGRHIRYPSLSYIQVPPEKNI